MRAGRPVPGRAPEAQDLAGGQPGTAVKHL